MKTKISKALIVAMVAAMMSTVALPVFAAPTVRTAGDNWVGSDYVDATHQGTAITTKQTITASNVTADGVTVTAYQLIKGQYKDGKLTGYVKTDNNFAITDFEHPTQNEISAIANQIQASNANATGALPLTGVQGIVMSKGDGTTVPATSYTANVEAGLYLVLVSGADAIVYNPAIVAVNISDADDVAGTAGGSHTSVDYTSYWTIPTQAMLKSSTSGFNKDIVGTSTRNTSGETVTTNTEGNTVDYGDEESFILNEMIIPSYTLDYPEHHSPGVIYKIEDQLDGTAFAGIKNFTVKVAPTATIATSDAIPAVNDNGTPANDTDDITNYTVTFKNASGTVVTGDDIATSAVSYVLEFDDAFIRANAEKAVQITYDSPVTTNAGLNYAENKTTAKLSYTRSATDNTNVKTLTDSTYTYVYAIDGVVNGNGSSETYELNKVTAAGGTYSDATGVVSGETTQKSDKALAGATFTLYSDAAMTNALGTSVSDANGHITFKGLDTGVYYLKETDAPATYTLNDNDYQVTISADLNAEGVMTQYIIDIKAKDATTGNYTTNVGTTTVTATSSVDEAGVTLAALNAVTFTPTVTVSAGEVVDTKIAELPATGGAGTIALTIGAAIGMGGFLTLFIIMKKKGKRAKE